MSQTVVDPSRTESNSRLAERHLRELRDASGLDAESIARRGYRTVTDASELLALGFEDYAARRVPGYLLPVTDTRGRNGRYYFKPDRPRPDPERSDRVVKYESQPKRVGGVVIDVPWRSLARLQDWRVPLLLTEGQKKADAADQLGDYAVLDFIGVWCWGWSQWRETGDPLDDWRPILASLKGRVCYVCFDSDAVLKDAVRAAETHLAEFLEAYGARVYVVRLPTEPDGSKNGLDDFLVRHGSAAFEGLVREARNLTHQTLHGGRDLELERSAIFRALYNPRVKNASARLSQVAAVNLLCQRRDVALQHGEEPKGRIVLDGKTPDGRPYGFARDIGLSGGTVRAGLKQAAALFRLNSAYDPDRGFSITTLELRDPNITPLQGYQALAALNPEPERVERRGGRRCPEHPHAGTVIQRSERCAECGRVLSDTYSSATPPISLTKVCTSPDDDPPALPLRIGAQSLASEMPDDDFYVAWAEEAES